MNDNDLRDALEEQAERAWYEWIRVGRGTGVEAIRHVMWRLAPRLAIARDAAVAVQVACKDCDWTGLDAEWYDHHRSAGHVGTGIPGERLDRGRRVAFSRALLGEKLREAGDR